MSKQKANPVSIPALCELYGKDPSQMRKLLDKLEITRITVRRADDNKVVTAISDADHQRLVDETPCLQPCAKATKNDVSIAEACKLLGYKNDQMTNFMRACASWGIEIYERQFKVISTVREKAKDKDGNSIKTKDGKNKLIPKEVEMTRALKCISSKDFEKAKTLRKIAVVDID